ncbi:lon protease [bacterium BMS3Abin07]|nr:lon protease [bacterium BMS3Abin07]GBE32301.1 lon protease [bacterium BMS3Bbin05]
MKPLIADSLYKQCGPDTLTFMTTEDIPPLEDTIGQDRALRAIDFGLGLDSKGFNIYILGDSGTGKLTTIKRLLSRKSINEPVPPDWCYVYNFVDVDNPISLSVDPGDGIMFKKDMNGLINTLKIEIPKVFETKEYERQRIKIIEEFQKKQKDLFLAIENEASEKGFIIRKTASGLLIVPKKKTGEPLSQEEYEHLDDKTKKKIDSTGNELQEKLNDRVRTVREGEKIVNDMLLRLERETALSAIGDLINDVKSKYQKYEKILLYLDNVQDDVLNNLEDFKPQQEAQPALPFMKMPKQENTFIKYHVNIIVNNKDIEGAPCVYESNPTYYNLFGRVEHKFQYGMALTDFSMIKAGALHRANGGYLIINAIDLLRNLFSYDSLKRAIRDREIRIEDIWEQYRLMTTSILKPQSIPLDIKIILIGPPNIYYLLHNLDEEYRELFKVKADFDSRMKRSGENIQKYVSFIATKAREEGLMQFNRSGVSRIVEYGSRLAGHQEKLSSKFSDIADLIRESHYWATKEGSDSVTGEHVIKALNEKIYRHNRIDDYLLEMMAEGSLIVRTQGKMIGQVNGLAVMDMGDYMFGKPSRITAKTFTGKAGIINIERETKMSGKIHEKAILILSNYLGSKYAIKNPISLSASITFEQLYSMIEGDSATCAEMYALLSSIANIPLKQSFAVTGSMDQNGDVQPVGGVNEKIEGFFNLCRLRGLDGTQGVIIPRKNIINLMLKKEVVDAVKEEGFSIYAIEKMEEGLEILTGMNIGILGEDGTYPEDTFNYLVEKRLTEIREAMKPSKENKNRNDEKN